jgi:hypothetical protein
MTVDRVNQRADLGTSLNTQKAGRYPKKGLIKEGGSLPTRNFVVPQNNRSFSSQSRRSSKPNRRPRKGRAALGLRYTTFEDRLKVLEQDPYVLEIWQYENMIQCGACRKQIQLDNRKPRSLQLQNWTTHRGRCHRIKAKVLAASLYNLLCARFDHHAGRTTLQGDARAYFPDPQAIVVCMTLVALSSQPPVNRTQVHDQGDNQNTHQTCRPSGSGLFVRVSI